MTGVGFVVVCLEHRVHDEIVCTTVSLVFTNKVPTLSVLQCYIVSPVVLPTGNSWQTEQVVDWVAI